MPSEREHSGPRPREGGGHAASSPDAADAVNSSLSSSDALRRALDRAMAHTHAELAHLSPADELGAFLSALRSAVDRLLDAGDSHTLDLPALASPDRVVGSVRRAFIDLIDGADELRAREAIAILGALGQLERAVSSGDDTPVLPSPSYAAPLGLSVEIAHDMRSPLTAILFLLDMVRSGRSGPITATQARQLGIAYGAALGLNQMAADLIDHARGHSRIIEPQPVPFSVTEILHSVRDILAPVIEERGLAMHIGSLADHARVGFPTALHRILLNLATNAVKYTASGSVTVSARALDGARVRFAVEDTGRGIPPSVREQLFRPFRFGARPGRPTFSSAGLGLSICKELVAALGGELSLTSEEGVGTSFFFELDLPIARHD